MPDPNALDEAKPAAPRGTDVAFLLTAIDRDVPIPLSVQLRGVIEYGILMGTLPPGTRLPTVRELSEQAGIATMTVVGVYNRMKEAGLIETRGKAGTFVADRTELPAPDSLQDLAASVDALLRKGEALGIDARRIVDMVEVRSKLRRGRPSLDILLVGLFEAATEDYDRQLRAILDPVDRFRSTTLDRLRAEPLTALPDLVLTLVTRRAEVQAAFPAPVPVAGVYFIPSTETRMRLASLESATRVGIVSTFPEFVVQMRLNARRFMPHVTVEVSTVIDAPDLEESLRDVEVVVYASGAERVLELVRPPQTAMEYRHMPDLSALQADVLPRLEKLRELKATAGGA